MYEYWIQCIVEGTFLARAVKLRLFIEQGACTANTCVSLARLNPIRVFRRHLSRASYLVGLVPTHYLGEEVFSQITDNINKELEKFCNVVPTFS